jgi:excisionase family DNA binding protein
MKAGEAAEYANVSKRTIYTAIRRDRLRAARIGAGRNVVISDAAIDRWLEESQSPAAGSPQHGGARA